MLYIIAGHGGGDPGACGNGYTEAERVRALAARMAALGGKEVYLCDTSVDWYVTNGISTADFGKGNQIIELHLDSFSNPTAKGGHVIIQAGIGGADSYDNALASYLGSTFPGRSNLIVERNDLANPARAAARGIGYRLVECCFISNASDIAKFSSSLDSVAAGLLNAFGIKTIQPKPDPTPEPPPEPTEEMYRVRTSWGDAKSQVGAYRSLDNAKKMADSKAELTYPHKVYDSKGNQVYP